LLIILMEHHIDNVLYGFAHTIEQETDQSVAERPSFAPLPTSAKSLSAFVRAAQRSLKPRSIRNRVSMTAQSTRIAQSVMRSQTQLATERSISISPLQAPLS